jgi:hypothetical protein
MTTAAVALPQAKRGAKTTSAPPNVKLTAAIRHPRIDGDKQAFFDNAAANARLTRESRAPFVVPKPDEI